MPEPLTPEQEREAREIVQEIQATSQNVLRVLLAAALATIDALRTDHDFMGRALDTMHKINARLEVEARRWRAVRDRVFTSGNEKADEAADRLAAEQEATA